MFLFFLRSTYSLSLSACGEIFWCEEKWIDEKFLTPFKTECRRLCWRIHWTSKEFEETEVRPTELPFPTVLGLAYENLCCVENGLRQTRIVFRLIEAFCWILFCPRLVTPFLSLNYLESNLILVLVSCYYKTRTTSGVYWERILPL